MPDATGLELLAQDLGEAALQTVYFRKRATILIDPTHVCAVLQTMREKGYSFLASVHAGAHYPEEPRLGVVYQLLEMSRVDPITIKLRVPIDSPEVDAVTPQWP